MRPSIIYLAVLTLAGSAAPATAQAESPAGEYRFTGRVVAVEDGDTLTLRGDRHGRRHRIRLSDLDAPETRHRDRPGQPQGQAAAAALRGLTLDRRVTAECFEADSYGSHVCLVIVDGRQVNAALLQAGWAWPAEKPAWIRDPGTPALVAEARAAGRGIWAGPDRISPWAWRRSCWKDRICPNAE